MISQQLWIALDLPDRLAMSNSTSGRTGPVDFHFKVSTLYTFRVDNLIPAATVTRGPKGVIKWPNGPFAWEQLDITPVAHVTQTM